MDVSHLVCNFYFHVHTTLMLSDRDVRITGLFYVSETAVYKSSSWSYREKEHSVNHEIGRHMSTLDLK